MKPLCLGIDISKAKFDLALLLETGKLRHKVFPDTDAGYKLLSTWLSKQKVEHVHACMEATGIDNHPSLKQQRDLLSSIPGIGTLQPQSFRQKSET